MANPTMTLIASQTLSTSASSITFSSIPQTYFDLRIFSSVRETGTAQQDSMFLTLNSDGGSNYSSTNMNSAAGGATVTSTHQTNATFVNLINASQGTGYTANGFAICETYIGNYTSTSAKGIFTFATTFNNAYPNNGGLIASVYRNSSGITTINLAPGASSFATYSSFYLYGIKNS